MKNLIFVFFILTFGLQFQNCTPTKVQAQTIQIEAIPIKTVKATQKAQLFTNFEAAKSYAVAQNVNILLVFGGSDWCKPCIRFKNDILESETFKSWSSENMAVLYLDFPAKKQNKLSDKQTAHNEKLAEQFNKSGFFPNIFVVDTDEKVLANPKFKNQDTPTFIEELQRIK